MTVAVSAPGKSILMGEHSAVYGRPALVAAVDRRLTVDVQARDDHQVGLDLPGIGVSTRIAWAEILEETRRARELWEAYDRDPGPETFRGLRSRDPARLVKIALGEAAGWLGEPDDELAHDGLDLRLDSEIPFGAGFGSSAAAAVAVVRAVASLRGQSISMDELHRVTLDVERRQHGRPSGIDNATVIHGGLVWAERRGDELTTAPLPASPVLDRIQIYNSGEPTDSTGDVVAAVRGLQTTDPERHGELIERMDAATRGLRRTLVDSGDREDDDPQDRIVELFREFEACLEGLGVVPEPVQAVIRRIEAQGGAAKISGAGALGGDGAGSVLVYHPAAEPPDLECPSTWARLDVRLGAEGVRTEPLGRPDAK